MNDADWDKVATRLSCNGFAKLEVDGYEVNLIYATDIKKGVTYIITAIDNKFNPVKWIEDGDEICRKFLDVKYPNKLTPKKKEQMIKKLGKRNAEEFIKAHRDWYEYAEYTPYWSSLNKLKRHFEKHNSTIKIKE